MLRKTLLAMAAIAAVGLFTPNSASAFGGHGGGGGGHGGGFGGHGGGFGGHGGFGGGGFHGGGFHGGGFHGGGFHRGFGIGAFGLGVGLGYGLYGPGYYGYDSPYYGDYYADEGSCYIVRRRVHTRHGWRIRPVEVCN
jgi:hypothetical protein